MTNEAIEKLAREYAEYCGNGKVVVESRYDIMSEALRWLLRTHCIDSKEKIMDEYEGWRQFLGTKDEEMAMAGMWQIRELFGSDLSFDDNDNVLRD